MRPAPNPRIEPYRRSFGKYASLEGTNNGAFLIPGPDHRKPLYIIASDGMGWEHVSVSCKGRIPTWDEMCFVKDTFWEPEECVIQFHPPKSRYLNIHPHVLHLWRPTGKPIPMPPLEMI